MFLAGLAQLDNPKYINILSTKMVEKLRLLESSPKYGSSNSQMVLMYIGIRQTFNECVQSTCLDMVAYIGKMLSLHQ